MASPTLRTSEKPTRTRYVVLSLTVAAYMITYMDRVVMATATPSIRQEFSLDLITMGWILFSFRIGYTLFQIPSAWLGDRIGPRRALSLIVVWWSLFTSLTASAWSTGSMIAFRFLFGVGEAGAFPIATRSLSRWMLPSERGFAQGVTHAGSRLGATLTPPLVVALILAYDWRMPFFVFGVLGLFWAGAWFYYYRDTPEEHAGVNEAERHLLSGALGTKRSAAVREVPWKLLLRNPTLRYLSLAYFCYSYCIATYLEWLPTYLKEYRGMSLKEMGFYAMLPLLAGTLGDLVGGWVSDLRYRATGDLKMARRQVAMAGFLIAALGIVPATLTSDAVACVVYTCLGVFGLEVTVGVSWAIPMDIGGDFAGSASAIMNSFGNIGGSISPVMLAYLVEGYGWNVPFLVASVLCVVAAVIYLKVDATHRVFPEPV